MTTVEKEVTTVTYVCLSEHQTLLTTRQRARVVVASLATVAEHVVADLADVQVVTASFLDEFIKRLSDRGVTSLQFTNASDNVRENLAMLRETQEPVSQYRALAELAAV